MLFRFCSPIAHFLCFTGSCGDIKRSRADEGDGEMWRSSGSVGSATLQASINAWDNNVQLRGGPLPVFCSIFAMLTPCTELQSLVQHHKHTHTHTHTYTTPLTHSLTHF